MKITLPKSRIVPLFVLAVLGTLLSLMLGLNYIRQMAIVSYKTTMDYYDTLAENTTIMLKQVVEKNYQTLQVAANLVGQTGELKEDKVKSLLELFEEDKTFISFAIVGLDGKGYNSKGEDIDASGETYFTKARNGHACVSNTISYTQDNAPMVFYAIPIVNNNTSKGVLLAAVSAQIETASYIDIEDFEGRAIYILNDSMELISFFKGSNIVDFDYGRVVKKGYFHENLEQHIDEMKLREFLWKIDKQKEGFVWYQKPMGINNWTVLIGTPDVFDPIAQELIKTSNMIWTLIMAGIFLLFISLIVFQRKSNRKVIEMLYLDPVTGGGNWYKFRINVNKILNSRQFVKRNFALINFDINRFKVINDAYGYQKGDEVLKEIYSVLKKWVKEGEPFTRYSADQFYILMTFQEEQEVIERINDLNERLHQLYYTKTVKFYFGVYYITERQDSIDRMGEFAGIAKHKIKGSNEGIISFFDDTARGRLLDEEEMEMNMYDALNNNEFIMYLQPKYAAKEETVTGAEALVRWQNNGKLVTPGYFIPVFEKNGFIVELDMFMLRKVCELLREWIDKGFAPLPLSVNISRIHFSNPLFAKDIKKIVDEYDIPHELIELELTESAFLQSKQALIKTVIELKQYGFLVSMDDFGAGYSSLNSLKDLPLDIVKLDGELFRITDEVERGFTVIRNTILMAKDLHMKVVAECIETREQVEFLCTVGCDIIQGYYFAKPMPVDQFETRYLTLID